MKRYVPTLESYSQVIRLIESPDDIAIGDFSQPGKPDAVTISRDYDKAYPFLVYADPQSGESVAKIANMPGDHLKLAIQLAPKMGIDASAIGTEKSPLSDIAKDAGRMFAFGEASGFVMISFYGATNKSQDINLSGMLFTKKEPVDQSSIELVAKEVKSKFPNHNVYLDKTESKENPVMPEPLLGAPSFDSMPEYYKMVSNAAESTISGELAKQQSISQYLKTEPAEPERRTYERPKAGTMRPE